MFEVAYLHPNETDLVGLSGPFPTARKMLSLHSPLFEKPNVIKAITTGTAVSS